jgi:hypothetical protein
MVSEGQQELRRRNRLFAASASRKKYVEFYVIYCDSPVDAVRCGEYMQISDEHTTTEVVVTVSQQCDHPRPFLWVCELPPDNARAGHCAHTAAWSKE